MVKWICVNEIYLQLANIVCLVFVYFSNFSEKYLYSLKINQISYLILKLLRLYFKALYHLY